MKAPNKNEARKIVEQLGFTELFDTGASGDYRYGSRLYFKKPEAELNQWGVPIDHATISKIDKTTWHVSVFERNAK